MNQNVLGQEVCDQSLKSSVRGAQLSRCSEIFGQSLSSTCEGVHF